MKFLRFRLSSVLIVFTVVALLLGYTQVRRRSLNRAFAELRARGCSVRYEDHWLWPVVPKRASVAFREWHSNLYTTDIGDLPRDSYASIQEAADHFKSLRTELLGLGIENVVMLKVQMDAASGGDVLSTIAPESIGL